MPLTRSMGLKPVRFSTDEVRFWLPLHNNQNDKGTAFGGSTAAAMILAGWSLVHLNLQKQGVTADVVIYQNTCQWQRPLRGDAWVVARFSSDVNVTKRRKWGTRRMRICCQVGVYDKQGQQHSHMQADYVILPAKTQNQACSQEAV